MILNINNEKKRKVISKKVLPILSLILIYFLGTYFLERFFIIENFIQTFISSESYPIIANITKSTIKVFLMLLPFIGITLFEILRGENNLKFLEKVSIYKNFGSKYEKGFDLIFYLISIFLGRASFIVLVISFGTLKLNSNLSEKFNDIYTNIFRENGNINPIILMIIIILLIDFKKYLEHRITHSIPISWDCHEFHHSAKEMNIFNSFRQTPHELLFSRFLTLPIDTFTGFFLAQLINNNHFLPLLIYLIYTKFHFLNVLLGHSSTKILYPKPISYFLMSPSLHWIHHSNNKSHFDKNFGQGFTFWDIIFKTYLSEKHIKDIREFGIDNSIYFNQNPLKQYFILPVNLMIRRIKKFGLIKSFI